MSDKNFTNNVFNELVFGLIETESKPPQILGYLHTRGMAEEHGTDSKAFIDLANDVVAIVGKNGAGKSTILNEFALAARPWCEVHFRIETEDLLPTLPQRYSPYWRGGFILQSPRKYLHSNPGKLPSLKYVDLNEPATEDREILSFLYIPPASDFATEFARNNLDWYTLHHYAEFDSYQEEMREKACIGIFPARVQGVMEANNGADNPLRSEWLIARVVLHNEDTPISNKFVNFLKTRLTSIPRPDGEFKYSDFVDGLTRWDENHEPIVGQLTSLKTFPITVNPFFTPWSLGGRFVWSSWHLDLPEDLDDLKTMETSISIERPKHSQDFDSSFLVACIDPKLLNLEGKNDLEAMVSSMPERLHSYSKRFTKENILEKWANNQPRVLEILKEWNVVQAFYELGSIDLSALSLRINPESGNFSDIENEYNQTARTWIHRAWQIACLEQAETSYKIAIWDEPELGLHPTALDAIVENVIPFMKRQGIKLIYATHSMRLALAAQSIKSCTRDSHGIPELSDWHGIDSASARELGFSKIDLLETIKKIIIVEGEMDFVVLSTLFQDELVAHRTKLLTLNGTENLLTIPNAGIIIDSIDSEILIVLDGRLRSKIKQEHVDALNAACKSGDAENVKRTLRQIRKAVDDIKDEGKKLLALLDLLVARVDSDILKRFSFFMFNGNDISNELPIRAVLGEKSLFTNWAQVDIAMKKAGIRINSKSQKEFLRSKGSPINKDTCGAGARALLDKPLEGDFKKLRSVAFGLDK